MTEDQMRSEVFRSLRVTSAAVQLIVMPRGSASAEPFRATVLNLQYLAPYFISAVTRTSAAPQKCRAACVRLVAGPRPVKWKSHQNHILDISAELGGRRREGRRGVNVSNKRN